MKVLPCVYLFLLCLLFTGCSPGGKILFLKTPYRTYPFEKDAGAGEEIRQICKSNDVDWSVVVMGEDQTSEVLLAQARQLLSGQNLRFVFIDPLLPFVWDELSGEFPEVGFVVLDPAYTGKDRNVLRLSFDKSDAFRKAGEICARLLRDEADFLVPLQAPGEKLKMGLFSFRYGNSDANHLLSEFRDSFLKGYPEDGLLEMELRNIHDRNDINKKMEELVRQGGVIVLPELWLSNPYCLEIGAEKNRYLVMEDWYFGNSPLDACVLLSPSESLPVALQAVFSLAEKRDKSIKDFHWPQPVVEATGVLRINPGLEDLFPEIKAFPEE